MVPTQLATQQQWPRIDPREAVERLPLRTASWDGRDASSSGSPRGGMHLSFVPTRRARGLRAGSASASPREQPTDGRRRGGSGEPPERRGDQGTRTTCDGLRERAPEPANSLTRTRSVLRARPPVAYWRRRRRRVPAPPRACRADLPGRPTVACPARLRTYRTADKRPSPADAASPQ